MAETSHSRIGQQSQTDNVFSSFPALNSHGLSSGLVTLSPHVEGLSIRNINAPVMSDNHVHITTNYYGSKANFEDSDASFAVLRVGNIHLEEEMESYLDANNVWRARYKGQIMASSTLNMWIWSYRGERAEEAFEKAYKQYASLPRHPNILQLYGICRSPHLTALVFHGAPHFIDQREYFKTLPSSQLNIYLSKFWQQYESAHRMLEAHNVQGSRLALSNVDETGKLVIAQFFPGPSDYSAFDTQICTAFETNTFIKEDLLDYYKLLFGMINWPCYLLDSPLPVHLDHAATFRLFHPQINLPGAFGITVAYRWSTYAFPIPPQFYQILQTIHEGCGFDPYSTQVAEYLSLPLALIDSGHSGLEEYVGDSEYTSESESGDSDYVSASEDV
ncbi:hypothetical protein C8J56DRAFT_1081830 [Mycena floridula]|nr:hypothetical protein C8J56DRAFT_1081830 [Mycena floridula]